MKAQEQIERSRSHIMVKQYNLHFLWFNNKNLIIRYSAIWQSLIDYYII